MAAARNAVHRGAPVRAAGCAPSALAVAALVLLVQLALGGWTSTNYATLACTDFPLCGGKAIPEMDFEHGFTCGANWARRPPATTCRSRR
jgi:heme A synthase